MNNLPFVYILTLFDLLITPAGLMADSADSCSDDPPVSLPYTCYCRTEQLVTTHNLANNCLSVCKYPRDHAFPRIVLLGNGNLAFLLSRGRHRFVAAAAEGPTCGLIPLNGPCRSVTTTGLKWNLSNGTLEMASFISTSNSLVLKSTGDADASEEPSDCQTSSDRFINHCSDSTSAEYVYEPVEVETDNDLLFTITYR